MNFSFELQGAMMTGSVTPEVMTSFNTIVGAFFGGLAMVWAIIRLALAIFMIISLWRVFNKAGLPGRGILIPVYNRVLMFKLGGMSGRRTLSILFPPLFLVMMIINAFKIAERFGKHWTFGLGIILIKFVFIPILAFDKSKYLTKKPTRKTVTFAAKKIITKAPTKKVIKKTPAKKIIKKVKTFSKKK